MLTTTSLVALKHLILFGWLFQLRLISVNRLELKQFQQINMKMQRINQADMAYLDPSNGFPIVMGHSESLARN